jgi:transcriptional adapter 2-alpha
MEGRKMQAADKKRPREDKEILHRLRPFAKLQTAEDYEVFCADILCASVSLPFLVALAGFAHRPPPAAADESMLRKRVAELQNFRRLGLTNAAEIPKYEEDSYKRVRVSALSVCLRFYSRVC